MIAPQLDHSVRLAFCRGMTLARVVAVLGRASNVTSFGPLSCICARSRCGARTLWPQPLATVVLGDSTQTGELERKVVAKGKHCLLSGWSTAVATIAASERKRPSLPQRCPSTNKPAMMTIRVGIAILTANPSCTSDIVPLLDTRPRCGQSLAEALEALAAGKERNHGNVGSGKVTNKFSFLSFRGNFSLTSNIK